MRCCRASAPHRASPVSPALGLGHILRRFERDHIGHHHTPADLVEQVQGIGLGQMDQRAGVRHDHVGPLDRGFYVVHVILTGP